MVRAPPSPKDNVHQMATRRSPVRVPEVTARRDGRSVNPLTTFVRSLGNDRAVANAQASLAVRRREDWLVLGLAHRLERQRLAAPRPAATTGPAARRIA